MFYQQRGTFRIICLAAFKARGDVKHVSFNLQLISLIICNMNKQ